MKLPILTFVLSILILMENLYLVEKKSWQKLIGILRNQDWLLTSMNKVQIRNPNSSWPLLFEFLQGLAADAWVKWKTWFSAT